MQSQTVQSRPAPAHHLIEDRLIHRDAERSGHNSAIKTQ